MSDYNKKMAETLKFKLDYIDYLKVVLEDATVGSIVGLATGDYYLRGFYRELMFIVELQLLQEEEGLHKLVDNALAK